MCKRKCDAATHSPQDHRSVVRHGQEQKGAEERRGDVVEDRRTTDRFVAANKARRAADIAPYTAGGATGSASPKGDQAKAPQ